MNPSPSERFEAKVERITASGCWIWIGALSIGGYGKFLLDGRLIYAHRFSFERWRGPIQDQRVLDHICRVRPCVNPWHLRSVSYQTNSIENSLGMSAIHAKKTRCGICGSDYVWRRDRNARTCPTCNTKKCREYRLRNLERLREYERRKKNDDQHREA